VDKLINEVVT